MRGTGTHKTVGRAKAAGGSGDGGVNGDGGADEGVGVAGAAHASGGAGDRARDLFAGLGGHDEAALARLHDRLVRDAAGDGLLDVAYRTLDSPVGSLLLATTDEGLVRVAFAVQDHAAVLQGLADDVSPRVLRAPGRLDGAARQLDEYFTGRRTRFDLPLDWRLAHGFRRTVLERLRTIGYGHTESYAGVAAGAGSPRAVRAVGTACARNPLPLVVPCHRVVRSDGKEGGYAGGPEAKHLLLGLERGAGSRL